MQQQTAVANKSEIWLAPSNDELPKKEIDRDTITTSDNKGSKDAIIEGCFIF